MPITQDRMLALVQESRAAITIAGRLRQLAEDFTRLIASGQITRLEEAIHFYISDVRSVPVPAQHETRANEDHYRKEKRRNDRQRVKMEQRRRQDGKPSLGDLHLYRTGTLPPLPPLTWERKQELLREASETLQKIYSQEASPGSASMAGMQSDIVETDEPEDIATPNEIENSLAIGQSVIDTDDLV